MPKVPNSGSNQPRTLRERADQLMRMSPRDLGTMSIEETQRVVQELQTYQIELELQ